MTDIASRPYTVLSCAMSLDGYVDSASVRRLALSNEADFDRVDALRAGCDAILVGANTVRNDDPRLLVRSERRRHERVAAGIDASPTKVTVTRTGKLDRRGQFFTCGDTRKLVFCPTARVPALRSRLGDAAMIVDGGDSVDMAGVSAHLASHGVRRLLVEGGGTLHTQFLTADLADELQLVVAPFFVGDSRAHRFVGDGAFPWNPDRRAELAEARPIGDVVLLRYALSCRFDATASP
jgi:5-amino-6-(5-phosphoribosylamino)uracil reductase